MKKLSLVLLATLSLMYSVNSSAAKVKEWKFVEDYINLDNHQDLLIYYDTRSVQISKDTSRIVMKTLKSDFNEKQGSTVETIEYNCEKNKYRILKTIAYAVPMGAGEPGSEIAVTHSGAAPWRLVDQESQTGDLTKLACKYMKY